MERTMWSYLFLVALVVGILMGVTMVDAGAARSKNRGVRGIQKRRLHPHISSGSMSMSNSNSNSADGARTGTGFTNPKHGEPGHIHGYKTGDDLASGSNFVIANSMGITTQTSQLATYADKCDAAEAGAEFHTSSYVPVYYQYEILTSTSRNILQVVDIVDKAIQHFLAVWLVDCDTTAATTTTANGNTRKRQRALLQTTNVFRRLHRQLQMTLAPIMGTGVGDWDIVLLGGTAVEQCTSDLATVASVSPDLVCYKVVGSAYVYLDETMQVTPNDIETLALDTLTVGVNLADTDFTELDPDIYGLYLVTGYDEPPVTLMEANREANQRAWDVGSRGSATTETSIEGQQVADSQKSGRSGGAKFGIAFATLLCISIVAFFSVYLYKNRERLFDNEMRPSKKITKHHNLDDDMTVPSTRYEPSKARIVPDDSGSHGEMNITFRSFAASVGGGGGSTSPESTGTRPMSPEPATPRHFSNDEKILVDESNIVSPRSDWSSARSTISDVTEVPHYFPSQTPDDRIRLKLSKEKIRGSHRKPSQLTSPDRSYEVEDTVTL